MPCCPIWTCPRWFSAAVCYIETLKNGKARIATNRMEKKDKWLTLAMSDEVKMAFEVEQVNHDYGIVVAIGNNLSDAKIVAFVSFYRDHHNPDKDINKRMPTAQALKQYDEKLEALFEQEVGAI